MPRRDSTSSLTSMERLNCANSANTLQHHGSNSAISQMDVIVVGAGLSGLNAAKDCHDKGLNVLVLEARDRIGGRTLTDDNGADLGGCYISQDQACMMSLIHELGLKTQSNTFGYGKSNVYHDSNTGVTYRLDNCYGSFPYSNGFVNLLVKLDYLAIRNKINQMCNRVPLSEPWRAKYALEWDSITFRSFVDSYCYTSQVKQYILDSLVLTSTTNDAGDFSLLWALWYIRSWGGFDKLIGGGGTGASGSGASTGPSDATHASHATHTSSNMLRVQGGAQLICNRLCQQVCEDRVLLNKRVVSIDQETRKGACLVRTQDGATYESQHVIVSVAPMLQLAIEFKPSLPSMRKQLIQRMPAGLCSKVILYYDKPYWFDQRFSGNMVISRPASANKIYSLTSSNLNLSMSASTSRRRFSPSGDVDGSDLMMQSKSDLTFGQHNNIITHNNVNSNRKQTQVSANNKNPYLVNMVVADYTENKPALVGFICGASAWLQYSNDCDTAKKIQDIANCYARILNCPQLANPIGHKEKNWNDDDYALGAYTTIMTPGTLTKFGFCLRQNFGHVWFASSETSISWPCSMEGAVRSGKLVARQVSQAISHGIEAGRAVELDEDDVPLILSPTFLERHACTGLTILKFMCAAPTVILISLAFAGIVRGTCRLTLKI